MRKRTVKPVVFGVQSLPLQGVAAGCFAGFSKDVRRCASSPDVRCGSSYDPAWPDIPAGPHRGRGRRFCAGQAITGMVAAPALCAGGSPFLLPTIAVRPTPAGAREKFQITVRSARAEHFGVVRRAAR